MTALRIAIFLFGYHGLRFAWAAAGSPGPTVQV